MNSNNTKKHNQTWSQTHRCINYEIKLLKKIPIIEEDNTPATIEVRSNETPIDHIDDLETVKNSVYEFEEVLSYMKHEIKHLKSTAVQ